MKRIDVLKQFFDRPPLANREILDLKRADPDAVGELARLAAEELGIELDVQQ